MCEYEYSVKLYDEEDDEYRVEYFTFLGEVGLTTKQLLDIFHERAMLKYGDYIEIILI